MLITNVEIYVTIAFKYVKQFKIYVAIEHKRET